MLTFIYIYLLILTLLSVAQSHCESVNITNEIQHSRPSLKYLQTPFVLPQGLNALVISDPSYISFILQVPQASCVWYLCPIPLAYTYRSYVKWKVRLRSIPSSQYWGFGPYKLGPAKWNEFASTAWWCRQVQCSAALWRKHQQANLKPTYVNPKHRTPRPSGWHCKHTYLCQLNFLMRKRFLGHTRMQYLRSPWFWEIWLNRLPTTRRPCMNWTWETYDLASKSTYAKLVIYSTSICFVLFFPTMEEFMRKKFSG